MIQSLGKMSFRIRPCWFGHPKRKLVSSLSKLWHWIAKSWRKFWMFGAPGSLLPRLWQLNLFGMRPVCLKPCSDQTFFSGEMYFLFHFEVVLSSTEFMVLTGWGFPFWGTAGGKSPQAPSFDAGFCADQLWCSINQGLYVLLGSSP